MKFNDFKLAQGKHDSIINKKMFFISGAPKSGTTWLQKALDNHPEIACSGEGHFFNTFGDLLKQLVNLYNDQILDFVTREVYEGKPYYEKINNSDMDFLMTSFIGMMMSKRKIEEGTLFIGDKTPANALYMDIIHKTFPEAKFIHIYRDCRDVVVSTYMHGLRIGDKPEGIRDYIETVTKRWVEWNEAALKFAKRKDAFFSVYYEDLIEDFPKHFSNILRFLGADDSENILNHCTEAASFTKLTGGRKRGEENSASFYRKGIVGDWKNYFSAEDLDLLNQIGGKMLKQLGYTNNHKVFHKESNNYMVVNIDNIDNNMGNPG